MYIFNQRLANEHGLDLIFYKPFDQIFQEFLQTPYYADSFERMEILNSQGDIAQDQWEAITIYAAFAFQKKFI